MFVHVLHRYAIEYLCLKICEIFLCDLYITLLDGHTFRTLPRRGPTEGLGIFQFLFLRFLLVPSVRRLQPLYLLSLITYNSYFH